MNLEGEHVFKGPREEVWEMFRDPEVLASALPELNLSTRSTRMSMKAR